MLRNITDNCHAKDFFIFFGKAISLVIIGRKNVEDENSQFPTVELLADARFRVNLCVRKSTNRLPKIKSYPGENDTQQQTQLSE